MAAIRRNIESVTSEQGGRRSRTITYRTDFAAKDLPRNLGVDDMPTIGQTFHPEDTSLVARSFSATREGTGSLVTVTFATPTFGRLTYDEPNTIGSAFYYGASIEIVNVQIPTAIRFPVEVGSGAGSISILPWQAGETAEIQESRLTITASYSIFQPDIADFRTLNAQNNKIHEIGGSRYLFRVQGIRAQDNDQYEISVSWTEDTGTRGVDLPSSTDVALPGSNMDYAPGNDSLSIWPNVNGLIRSPFHRLGLQPSPDPVAEPPKVIQIQLYEEALNGWQTLGLPSGLLP